MEAKVYNSSGKDVSTVTLPESVFGVAWNADLVHQVMISMQGNARTAVAHTKDRSEVRGGGKKPWAQKGSGRARHGSSRSPIWIGGGVTHGPRNEKDYSRKLNRKMKAAALYSILSAKLKNGELLFVDSLAMENSKTKDAKSILENLSKVEGFDGLKTKTNNRACISMGTYDAKTAKSFSNFGNINLADVKELNAVNLLKYKYLVISNPAESIAFIESKLS